MSDWEDAPEDDWADEAGEWTDEAPKKEAPGVGTRALQLLSKGSKARDLMMAKLYDKGAAAYSLATGAPFKPAYRDGDFTKLVTTFEGGPDAGQYLERAGMAPEKAKWTGLAADILLPGDPTGAVIGKGIKAGSDMFRAAGLSKLLAAAPKAKEATILASLRARLAAFRTLKEAGVAGGATNQARLVQKGINTFDNAVTGAAEKAAEDGLKFSHPEFTADAGEMLANETRFTPGSQLDQAREYSRLVGAEAAREGSVSLPFANTLRKKIGSTSDEALREIRQMIRDRLVKDSGKYGETIDQSLLKEHQLLSMRGAANAAAKRSAAWKLPAATAAAGALMSSNFGDDFNIAGTARGALWGLLGAKAATSPFVLTRGAQLFNATSPVLGRAAAQGLYSLTPNEEKK